MRLPSKAGLILFVSFLAMALGGCGLTSTGDRVREEFAERGQEAADQSLANVEWTFCNVPTIGSLSRRYGDTPDVFAAYLALCGHEHLKIITTR